MTTLERPAPTFEDVWRLFQVTDKKFQETDRLLKARSEETDRKFQETSQLLKEVTRRIGQLGNRLGEFVEERVKPALVRLFQARGLQVHRTMHNLVCRDDAGQYRTEVDLLVVDGDTAIAVECKSNLSVEVVDEHIDRLALFKDCWPEYAGYRLLGGVAGWWCRRTPPATPIARASMSWHRAATPSKFVTMAALRRGNGEGLPPPLRLRQGQP